MILGRTFLCVLIVAVVLTSAAAVMAADRYWVAEKAGKWSDAANWSAESGGPGGASVPGRADKVIFDDKGPGDSTVDVGSAGSIVVTAGYKGTITQGKDLTVAGDMRVLGGSAVGWTFAQDKPAALTVKGNLSVAPNAYITCTRSSTQGEGRGRTITVGGNLIVLGTITADGQGFMKGPGTPPVPGLRKVDRDVSHMVDRYVGGADAEGQAKTCVVSPAGPGHGGRGAGIYRNPNGQYTYQPHYYFGQEQLGSGVWRFPGGDTYGSVTAPVSLGSGTADNPDFDPKNPYPFDRQNTFWTHKGAYGGGAVKLVVSGTANIEGRVTANGALAGETGASGGSVFIIASKLAGNGIIAANGSDGPGHGHGRGGGGGGRVAVILKKSADTGSVKLQAYGGEGRWSPAAAAGTVYIETANHKAGLGKLVIDNQGKESRSMFDINTSFCDKGGKAQSFGSIELRNRAILYIGRGCSITTGSLTSTCGNVIIDGGTLKAARVAGLRNEDTVRPHDEVTRRLGRKMRVMTFGSAHTMKEELLARSCQISVYPYLSKLDVSADLSTYGYQTEVADVRSAVVKVVSKSDGKELARATLKFSDKQFAQTQITLPTLKDGKYEVAITLDSGAKIAPMSFHREKLVWESNNLGYTDKVYYPFTPIEVEGNDIKLCNKRVYTMNGFGLFDKVISQGREITSGPMTVKVETEDGLKEWKFLDAKFTKIKGNEVEYVAEADSGPIKLTTKSITEFDGCTRVEMDMLPGSKPGEVKKLWVDIPLKDSEMPLFHNIQMIGIRWFYAGETPKGGQIEWESGIGQMSDRRPSIWWVKPGTEGQNDGVIWNSNCVRNAKILTVTPFIPYIWLGGGERGLAWFADNDKGWIPNTGQPGQFIVREGDKLVMRFYLINKPVTVKQKHHIVFGLQASPTKPMMPDWRTVTRQGYHGYMTPAFGMFCCTKYPIDCDFGLVDKSIQNRKDKAAGKKVGPQFLYDKVEELKAKGWPEGMTADSWLRKWVRPGWNNIVEDGPLSGVYFEEHWTDPGQVDVDQFGNEWACRRYLGYWPIREKNRIPYDSPFAEEIGLTGSFLSGTYPKSHVDFSVYYGNEYMKRGIGLYFDNTFPHICFNPTISDAYVAENGKIQPAVHMWNQREYYKRIWNLMCEYNEKMPDNPIYLTHHMTNTLILPWNTWTTMNSDIENRWVDINRRISPAVFPWGYILAESQGRQVGTPCRCLFQISGYDGTPRREWGMRRVHETDAYAPFNASVWPRELDKSFLDFGYGREGIQVINYWSDDPPVTVTNNEVKWIVMIRPEAPSTLMILQSYCFDPTTTKVAVENCKAWMDGETGKILKCAPDGTLDITFTEGYGTKLLIGAPAEADLKHWTPPAPMETPTKK